MYRNLFPASGIRRCDSQGTTLSVSRDFLSSRMSSWTKFKNVKLILKKNRVGEHQGVKKREQDAAGLLYRKEKLRAGWKGRSRKSGNTTKSFREYNMKLF